MSNAAEADTIGKELMREPDPQNQARGRALQGMFTELRKAEQVYAFIMSEGGEDAVADILIAHEAKRLRDERDRARQGELEIPVFPGNVVMHPAFAIAQGIHQ